VRIRSRRRVLYFLIPVLLVSGTWHAHLLAAHRQLSASNHFGVNLWRCWNTRVSPLAKPVVEQDAPLAPGRWANLNNPQHLKNSLRLRKKIIRYIVDHPGDSAAFMVGRVWKLTAGETAIYVHKPSSPVLSIYSPVVRVTSLVLIGGFFVLAGKLVWLAARRRDRLRELVGNVDHIIVFVAFSSLFILAVGEVEEEARFVLSLLPFLATLAPLHGFFLRGMMKPAPRSAGLRRTAVTGDGAHGSGASQH
jgi:hypothetical protein